MAVLLSCESLTKTFTSRPLFELCVLCTSAVILRCPPPEIHHRDTEIAEFLIKKNLCVLCASAVIPVFCAAGSVAGALARGITQHTWPCSSAHLTVFEAIGPST